ncbi:MAG: hypothetical protein H8E85_05930 [Candidatus Marinimicrobia bacterium]|nr:hypothetical protein [Candidatus Neomarinimicrobiota bacterium]
MLKLRLLIVLLGIFTSLFGDCDGFNWYHNIDIDHCDPGDREALNQFIKNSGNTLELDMDVNFNGEVDVLELGWQLWENGRLIHWICQEVPSPYYFYEYDCGLSGNIPSEVGNLDGLVKLRLQSNNLSGKIPDSICNLTIIDAGNYWFNIEKNNLCPPYPHCLEKLIGSQDITNCK